MLKKAALPTLLERVSDFENLLSAHHECSRHKRSKIGYKKSLFAVGERLLEIRDQLRDGTYTWGEYRSFIVTDPKARLVMAAPFMDRVVHHAIHRVIEPILDRELSDSVFACRHGRGNRKAIQATLLALRNLGPERFVVKLDVRKYFASIQHPVLERQLAAHLPDATLRPCFDRLLRSYPDYAAAARGIPIGNITSQLFANFYLAPADRVASDALGLPYFWTEETLFSDHSLGKKAGFYIRYMDDMLVISNSKARSLDAAEAIIEHCRTQLGLEIPFPDFDRRIAAMT